MTSVVLLMGSANPAEEKVDMLSKSDAMIKVLPSVSLEQGEPRSDQKRGKALIMEYVRSIMPVSFRANLSTWSDVINHVLNHTR